MSILTRYADHPFHSCILFSFVQMSKRARSEVDDDNSVLEFLGTPAPSGTMARTVNTPTRRTRLEEKNHLQILNKRLEYYIFTQREREASTAHIREELDTVRNQAKSEIDDLRNFYEDQLANNVNARDKLATELIKFKDESTRQARDLTNLRSNLGSLQDEKKTLESQLNDRNKEIRDLSANVMGLEDRLTSAERELSLLKQKLNASDIALTEARKSSADNANALSQERLRAEQLRQDLHLTEKKFEDEIAHYQNELNDLLRDRNKVEEVLRKEFGNQLKDILAERQAQFEQEKLELAKDLRDAFDLQMSKYVADFEAMKQDLQDALHAKGDLEEQIQNMDTRTVELETTRDALKEEANRLKEQLRKQAADQKVVVDGMMTRFNELRDMFLQKEEEFNTLMDVKITLAMEIKAYRALLDNEENRLGYALPRSIENQPIDKTEKLLIVGFDLDGTFIRMKNGATTDISLDGWKLRSQSTLREFLFPNVVMKPGKMFTLYFGKDAEKKVSEDAGISFAVNDIFAPSGDSGLVLDNIGRVANKIEFLSK